MVTTRRHLLTAAMASLAGAAVTTAPAARASAAPRQLLRAAVTRVSTPALSQVAAVTTASPLAHRVRVGAYVHLAGHPSADPVAPADLATLEGALGHPFDLVHYFFTWGRPFGEALNSNADGRDLMLSMKPDGSLVADIAAGRQDPYIDRFARDARTSGKRVYLRFGHEMNGQWMSYSAGSPGGPPAHLFITAWRHLVSRVRAQGARNVSFVWCPNESDFPNVAGNHLEDYWPGDAYVDVAAFDAYNWSSQRPARGDGTWRTFDQIVAGPYQRITQLTGRPLWLGEFGTTEAVPGIDPAGATKGDWFRAMFATTAFPRLQTLVYFSEDDQRDVQRDWRLDSTSDALRGFSDGWEGNYPAVPGKVTLATPLTLTTPWPGSPTTAAFTISNTGGAPLTVSDLLTGARTASGANVDFPAAKPTTLQPGQSLTYKGVRNLTPGTYTSWPAYYNGTHWIELTPHRTFTI